MSRPSQSMQGAIATRRSAEAGFTLLEVLIAFLILAVGLAAMASGIAVAMRSDVRADARRSAMRLAQSRLETAGITTPLVSGAREGQFDNGYGWRETITPVQLGGGRSAEMVATPARNGGKAPRPFWVDITVQTPGGIVAKIGALKLAYGEAQ